MRTFATLARHAGRRRERSLILDRCASPLAQRLEVQEPERSTPSHGALIAPRRNDARRAPRQPVASFSAYENSSLAERRLRRRRLFDLPRFSCRRESFSFSRRGALTDARARLRLASACVALFRGADSPRVPAQRSSHSPANTLGTPPACMRLQVELSSTFS